MNSICERELDEVEQTSRLLAEVRRRQGDHWDAGRGWTFVKLYPPYQHLRRIQGFREI
jgi:hypothetical protein